MPIDILPKDTPSLPYALSKEFYDALRIKVSHDPKYLLAP
jgi:hypothetical protein